MRIEPDEGTGVDDYVVVEEGTYPMRIESVRVSNNADGDVSWMLRMTLLEGDRAGRVAVVDWLNFSARGMHRVRSVLSTLGFDTSVSVEVETNMLEGKVANVRIVTQESSDPQTGKITRRSRVPYDGWSPCPDQDRFEGQPREAAYSTQASGGQAAGGAGAGLAADSMPF